MKFDENVRYQNSHEWSRKDGDVIVVGISDHAQDSLRDVVFVELPNVGDTFNKGDVFSTVESVKAASEIYAPVSGEVIEVNMELEDAPELINKDAFGKGWIFKLKVVSESDVDNMLDADSYEELFPAE